MQVKRKNISDTKVLLSISASEAYLTPIKQKTLEKLRGEVKLPGFREGKAPLNLVEKNINPQQLQSEFVEEAINQLYGEALESEKIRPVDRPQVGLKKFVPFTSLEFDAEVEVLGTVKLADYKKFKKKLEVPKPSEKDVNEVLDKLKLRAAEKKEVKRAALDKDEVWIDFKGVDAKGEAIKGADGKDYPLVIGSDSFIPGFEKNVLGMKAGDEKTFTLTFPKDYGVSALANKKVTFTVTAKKVQEVIVPKVDDAFVKQFGPFKNVDELKADIKAQLTKEKEAKARQELEVSLIEELAERSKLTVPETLIEDQLQRDMQTLKQNLTYRGQTYQEFLKTEKKTEDEYKKGVLMPQAEKRVKASLVLAEVSDKENLQV